MTETRKLHRHPASIDQMRQVCLHWRTDRHGRRVVAGSMFNRFVLRRISIYVTWVFVWFGIRANVATLVMIFSGLAGVAFGVPHVLSATIAAAVFFFLFDLFDAVDGEIARWDSSSSTKGLYLDQISHVLVDYPSLCVPALHHYAWTGDDRYLVLAMLTIVCAVMGRTIREMFFRINAESASRNVSAQPSTPRPSRRSSMIFLAACGRLKSMPLAAFPVTKARIVHITTIVATLLSYADHPFALVFTAWFYALYSVLRFVVEIPYYYWARVVDVAHSKQINDYRWPL